jgi:hypothetical protein
LQILNILKLFTPKDDYEERVAASFVKKVEVKLQSRKPRQEQDQVTYF